jgi:branched-chain amino acid transport system substrate-binding protein
MRLRGLAVASTRRQPVSSRVACCGTLKKTGGNSDGDALLAAMKGMAWESPRGPISIDAQTRDIVQNIYIRKFEKVNGQIYNTGFATYEAVNDPMKAGPK